MDYEVWIRDDFLMNCCHALSPPRQFTVTLLKRLIAYVRKTYNTFPKLSFKAWQHVACSKMELEDALCWMYYSSFYLFENLQLDSSTGQYLKPTVQFQKNSIGDVSCAGFALMAILQNACRPQVLTPSGNESFPSTTPASSPRLSDFSERLTDYFLSHLTEIFELLWICDIDLSLLDYHKASAKKLDMRSYFSLLSVQTLDWILEGTLDGTTVISFSELVQRAGMLSPSKSGSQQQRMSRPANEFMQWLRRGLVVNPLDGTHQGSSSSRRGGAFAAHVDLKLATPRATSGGGRVSMDRPQLLREDPVSVPPVVVSGGLLNNSMILDSATTPTGRPRSPNNNNSTFQSTISKNKNYDDSKLVRPTTFVMTGPVDNTVVVQNAELVGRSIKIVGTVDSTVYLPIPLANCQISNCRNSKIITGPITGVLRVENCSNCIIGALASKLVTYRASATTLFIRTPMAPLLIDSTAKFSSRVSSSPLAVPSGMARNNSSLSNQSLLGSTSPPPPASGDRTFTKSYSSSLPNGAAFLKNSIFSSNNSAINNSTTPDIILAPLNYNYPGLDDQIRACGFVTASDCWNNPLVLCDAPQSRRCPRFKLMDPVGFYRCIVPFHCVADSGPLVPVVGSENNTSAASPPAIIAKPPSPPTTRDTQDIVNMKLAFPLPDVYANQLANVTIITDDVNHYATSLTLNDEERKEAMAAIAELFYEWLEKQKPCEQNEMRHLANLSSEGASTERSGPL